MLAPAETREATGHLQKDIGTSERRVCRALGSDWTDLRHPAKRADDIELRARWTVLAEECPLFRNRRADVLLRLEGRVVGREADQRMYREAELTVRCRKGRSRAPRPRRPIKLPTCPGR